MLMNCIKIIWYCLLGSITTVACMYILISATEMVLCMLAYFLYGDDTEGENYEE